MPDSSRSPAAPASATITTLGFVAFAASGFTLVLVGANQAELARSLQLDLSRSGLLGAALSLGVGIGVTGAGPFADRHARRPLFVASLLVAAGALATMQDGISFGRAFAHILVLGIGVGFYDTLLNAVAIQQGGERAPRRLALLHAGATFGAVAGPPLMAWFSASGGWARGVHAVAVLMLSLAGVAAFVPLPRPRIARSRRPGEPAARSLRSLSLVFLALVGFSYVGAETALTIFAVPWATAVAREPRIGQVAISVFWFGLLAGRLGMLVIRRPLGAGFLVLSGLSAAGTLFAAIVFDASSIEAVMLAVGLALGAVYPVMIGLAGSRFPEASGTAAGLVAGASSLGGFAVPWIVGGLGDANGFRATVFGVIATCLLLAASATALRVRSRRELGQHSSHGNGRLAVKGDGAS